MVVTQIVGITASRSKVYLDEEFAFVLYKGELRHYKITQGGEVSGEVFDEICNLVLPKRAKLRGMALLKNRPYTKRQMEDKLRQGFYPEQVIGEAVSYLEAYGYINDAQYAQDYIGYHKESKSRRRLEQDLMRKGIEKQQIEAAFSDWEEQGGEAAEADQIADWIRKRSYDVHTTDLKEKQRMAAFLFRKGYDADKIQKALKCEEFD